MPESNGSDEISSTYWLSVIARALVYQSMQSAELQNAELAAQAKFLTGFGLARRHAAEMLGTTVNSVNIALSRAKPKAGGRRGKRKV